MCKEQKVRHETKSSGPGDGLLQYTRTQKYNLFILYNKNSNGLLNEFSGM